MEEATIVFKKRYVLSMLHSLKKCSDLNWSKNLRIIVVEKFVKLLLCISIITTS